jgi:hypothetical protein
MGRKNYKALSWVFICLVSLQACKKDKPDTKPVTGTPAGKVYVVCEGSLGNGNSALSLYEPETALAYEDVFKTANNESL